MPLIDSITVDARMLLSDLLDLIEDENLKTRITVRRFESGETYWYVYQVEDLLHYRGADEHLLGANLTDALNLHESDRDEQYQVAETRDPYASSGVLLHGDDLIGVLRPEPTTRGREDGLERADLGDLMTADGGSGAAAEREADRKPFSAYPWLTAPTSVASEQRFTLDVGLSANQVPGVTGGPISTADAPAAFAFDLQIVADRFSFPSGSKAKLEVDRDDFQAARASIELVAPEVTDRAGFRGVIEVLFFYEGNVCGRAERVMTVGGRTAPSDAVTEDTASSVSIPDHPAPDLTVTISPGSDERTLMWVFCSPHDLNEIPNSPITRRFLNHTAKSFALDKVKELAKWDKTSLTAAQMLGVGKEISATMPNEFWLVLDEVWEMKQRSGEGPPTILIVSKDPYVPWELAAMTREYWRPRLLDQSRPMFLGAQAYVGKWIPPVSTPRGGDIPTLPPVPESEVTNLVLFVGDYDAAQGHRPLPMAEEEGRKLATRYQGIRRTANLNDVTDLVRDEIREGGQRVVVDAIHFACHGEVSTEPRYNGIVLNDNGIRLGADIISGSSIGLTSNPFVFLNACQLGTETVGLDGNYGGMAGAFLSQGATGFIAPLWSVDDDVAQDFAIQFYKGVYDDHRPVADVLAELRSRFNADSAKPRSSYLAYVYYGHPALAINKAERA